MEHAKVCSQVLKRNFSYCYSPRPGGPCACPTVVPPTTPRGRLEAPDCSPKPVPYNPCKPIYTTTQGYTKYKLTFFFVCVPLMIAQMFRAFDHEPHHAEECRDYEYMRRRTKRFPWGEGTRSLFHNENVNSLPGECKPPPVDQCD